MDLKETRLTSEPVLENSFLNVHRDTIRLPNGDALIRRDADLDGWFDLRYVEHKGIATRLEQINEAAPRRKP